jgi:hypothetical protein
MKRLTFLLVFVCSAPAVAQQKRDSLPPAPWAERILIRTLLGTVSGVALAVPLAKFGAQADRAYDWTGGDDPGLGGLILGASLGYTIGSALGASIPALGTGCSAGQRLARSFGGAFGTLGASVLAAAATGGGGIVLMLGVPVGAAAANGRC